MMEIRPSDPEFVRVWNRVSKPQDSTEAPTPTPGWAEFLEGRLQAECQRVRDYRQLNLRQPLHESESRVKALGAAQFFQTGSTQFRHAPQGAPNCYSSKPEAIRTLYQNECAAETDYRRAAETCTDATLAGVFLRCAQSCQNGRLALWRSIEQAQYI